MARPRDAAKIEKYVDAVREYRALIEAQKLEGKTEDRTRLIKMAQATVRARSGAMTGGMIGAATRILEAVEAQDEEQKFAEETTHYVGELPDEGDASHDDIIC